MFLRFSYGGDGHTNICVTGEDLALSGGHTVQCTDLITLKPIPETNMFVLTNVTPVNLILKRFNCGPNRFGSVDRVSACGLKGSIPVKGMYLGCGHIPSRGCARGS